jgi:hypothetical protein
MARLLEATNRKRKQQSSTGIPSVSRPRLSSGNFSITFKEVGALSYASRLIPDRTPKRWELVSTLVSDYVTEDDRNSPNVHLSAENTVKSSPRQFNQSAADCKQVAQIISEKYPGTLEHSDEEVKAFLSNYPEKIALKHIVLIPPVKECCGMPIIIRSRPSFPIVYTMQGTFIAAVFNGECRKGCSKKFHYSFYHQGDTTHYYIPQSEKYFQSTSQTVFEVALLDDLTNNISISATSFESRAEVYNENFRDSDSSRLKHLRDYGRSISDVDHPWKLTEKRVEDAWFLFTLVCFFRDRNQLDSINFATGTSPSQRKDLDFLCGKAWEVISQSTNPWIHHKCHVLGCSEGMFLNFQ